MTPRQRQLARHALGLPNARRRSYRNRFCAAYVPGGDFDEWAALDRAGLARLINAQDRLATFHLTLAGARAALDPGESLCAEDFPDQDAQP